MNISEFQFRFLDIAEQIECASKESPLNLKETLNYWNILLSHLLELKDNETNTLKILRALEQLHQLLSIEEKKNFILQKHNPNIDGLAVNRNYALL